MTPPAMLKSRPSRPHDGIGLPGPGIDHRAPPYELMGNLPSTTLRSSSFRFGFLGLTQRPDTVPHLSPVYSSYIVCLRLPGNRDRFLSKDR